MGRNKKSRDSLRTEVANEKLRANRLLVVTVGQWLVIIAMGIVAIILW